MTANLKMSLALFAALALTSMTFFELSSDSSIVWLGLPVILLLLAIGVIGRRFKITAWLIHLWQVLALGAIALGLGVGAQPGGGNYLVQLKDLALQGILVIRTESAPLPPDGGVRWLFLLLLGLITILADILTITLASPAWSLAPLLSLYLIPALALPDNVHWYTFALIGAGYLIVLACDTDNDLGSWTRNLSQDSAARSHSSSGPWRMAAVVGIPVLAVAVLAGSILPRLGTLNIESRHPRGDAPLQLQDPTLDLSRNLNNQSTRVVVRYTSSNNSQGQYLRLTSLPKLSASGWGLTSMSLSTGSLNNPPGANATSSVTTKVTIGDFASQYLPAPYAPQSFDAKGSWGYDPVSLTVVATGDSNASATRNLSYSVTSAVVDPADPAYAKASAGSPSDAQLTTEVPKGVPARITELAGTITKGATSDTAKAAAIQTYLRDPKRFGYSTTAPSGSGYQVLENFLFDSREGYCIHFASAMALLARIEGIPSRVAIGFAPGELKGGSWEVMAKNMHAWPELYFAGYGWVRYEPTAAVGGAPAWTDPNGEQSPSASASATTAPSATQTQSVQPSASASASKSTAPQDPTFDQSPFPWGRVLGGLGIGVGLIAVLLLPAAFRAGVRRRRLGLSADPADQAEALWSELRDSMVDGGHRWPPGSPRTKAEQLGEGVSQAAQDAFTRVARVVERGRYSAAPVQVDDALRSDVRLFGTELRSTMTGSQLFAARFWPPSVWRNLSARLFGRS